MDRKPYPTDLRTRQWKGMEPWILKGTSTDRPPKYAKREIVKAILYVTRNGCTWRDLPHDFPPYETVYHWLRKWQGMRHRSGSTTSSMKGYVAKPEEAQTNAAVLDNQTIKTMEQGGPYGYDAGTKKCSAASGMHSLTRSGC